MARGALDRELVAAHVRQLRAELAGPTPAFELEGQDLQDDRDRAGRAEGWLLAWWPAELAPAGGSLPPSWPRHPFSPPPGARRRTP